MPSRNIHDCLNEKGRKSDPEQLGVPMSRGKPVVPTIPNNRRGTETSTFVKKQDTIRTTELLLLTALCHCHVTTAKRKGSTTYHLCFYHPVHSLDTSSGLEISPIRGPRLGSSPLKLDKPEHAVRFYRAFGSALPSLMDFLSSKFVDSHSSRKV